MTRGGTQATAFDKPRVRVACAFSPAVCEPSTRDGASSHRWMSPAQAGNASGWAGVEVDGRAWLYKRGCRPPNAAAVAAEATISVALGHLLDIVLPSLATASASVKRPSLSAGSASGATRFVIPSLRVKER